MPKLGICYAWTPPFAYSDFLETALNLRHPESWEVRWFRGQSWCVARSRSKAMELALDWGADAILLTDVDHVYEEDLLERLVARYEAGCEIVAPRIPMRGYIGQLGFPPFQKIGWRLDERARAGEIPVRDSKLVPIDPKDGDLQAAEFPNPGCLLFPAEALRKLDPGKPWLYEYLDPQTFGLKGGGDTVFVRRLQVEGGCKAWIDCTVEVKHLQTFSIDGTYPERFSDWAEPGIGDPRICSFGENGKRIQ